MRWLRRPETTDHYQATFDGTPNQVEAIKEHLAKLDASTPALFHDHATLLR